MLDIAIKTLFALFGVLITGVIIPYIKSKTSLAERETAMSLISSVVAAAEMKFASAGGIEKKKYVSQWLETRGITIDQAELDTLIESAVYALKNR